MKLLRDPLQPVDLVLMQKLSPFYPVCLPVASSYAVCLRFTCWSTRHGHVLSWPPKPPHTRTSFCFFCSVHSLTSHLRSKGSNCSTAFKKKKHFKMLCQFPASPHPKNKMFCLVILCMHYFSRLVHK